MGVFVGTSVLVVCHNDICNILKLVQLIIFADNANICCAGRII